MAEPAQVQAVQQVAVETLSIPKGWDQLGGFAGFATMIVAAGGWILHREYSRGYRKGRKDEHELWKDSEIVQLRADVANLKAELKGRAGNKPKEG